MLDFLNISTRQPDSTTFYASSSTVWQTWLKPRGCKFIQFFIVGAGGSGAGGQAINGVGRGGGSGGASGGVVRGIVPAFLVPDVLYVQVGTGGAAVGASTAGNTGGISYVSIAPSTSVSSVILASSSTVAGGGLTSSGGTNAGGTAPTIFTTAVGAHGSLCSFTAIAGQTGGTGATLGTPDVQALGASIVTGGAGGAGHTATANGNSGNILAATSLLLTAVTGGTTAVYTVPGSGTQGSNGYTLRSPAFCSVGGAGGGAASTSGTGGNGGAAGYGSGGGGGGCSLNIPSTRAAGGGGRGGDGLIIITALR